MNDPYGCRFASAAPRLVGLVLSVGLSGCGLISKMAGNSIAGLMEATTDVWASDEDPELVCESLPFALSTVEGLILRRPGSERFLLTATKGFTQYAHICVETDAILLEAEEYERSREQEERALRLYLRAKRYGIRGLAKKYEGIAEQLSVDPDGAAGRTTVKDVPLLYWTAAAWGAAISLGKDRPDLIADLPAVIAMMRRILELDEAFGDGAVHDLFIVIEGLPANMGGSPEKAREHFERALALNGGRLASTYAAYATSVMLPEQNRERFERLMLEALAIDPDDLPSYRLQNLIAQRRARYRLDHVDDYFVE